MSEQAAAKVTGAHLARTAYLYLLTRPPNRSVSAPTTTRPIDPTRIGVATSIDASVLLSDRSPA